MGADSTRRLAQKDKTVARDAPGPPSQKQAGHRSVRLPHYSVRATSVIS